MAWDPDELRAEVLNEFAGSAEFARAYDEWSTGAHYIKRALPKLPPTKEDLDRRRALHIERQRRYVEKILRAPPSGATRESLRRRSELRRIQRMDAVKQAHEEEDEGRERMPETRSGRTVHFTILTKLLPKDEGGKERVVEIDGYLTANTYPNGRLGEIFVKVSADTKRIHVMGPPLEDWAIAFSMCLQRGASVDKMCSKYIGSRYWPDGPVSGVEGVRRCTSPTDLICRYLRLRYGKKPLPPEGEKDPGQEG